MLWYKLCNSTENDYVDFKQQWYFGASEKVEMIHDILCMSNSLSDSLERYIVIGIAEDKISKKKKVVDVSTDKNCKTSENIIQTLRNYMPIIPKIEVLREDLKDGCIDIIKITPSSRDLPYVLSKNCEYEDEKKKKHCITKNWIYSRDGSRNTGKNEHCSKYVLEELFARKRGEHLPILERFSLYLDDLDSWNRPRGVGGKSISEDAYYYTKNHKFKIIRHKADDDAHKTMFQVIDYYQLLMETCLCKNYWDYRINSGSCYDDWYTTFNVELWADNTLIEVFEITDIYLKHYKMDTYRQGFYLPDRNDIFGNYDCVNSKEDVEKTLAWKICKLLFECDLYPESVYENKDASIILDELNYDYLSDPQKYINENQNMLFTPATTINHN